MQLTLTEAAELVSGQHFGSQQIVIRGTGTISSARQSEITFADSQKALDRLEGSPAEVVLVPLELEPTDRAYIQVADVREAFGKLVNYFRPRRRFARLGISPSAHVSKSANIADDVDVFPGAVIGDHVDIGPGTTIHGNVTIMDGSKIGENVTIYPGVVLYEDTIIGARCILHANCVVGAYGFGYDTTDEGTHQLGAQYGYVELGSRRRAWRGNHDRPRLVRRDDDWRGD